MTDDGPPSISLAGGMTVEITYGISDRTSRVELKKRMSAFGDVDVCHMGTRGQDCPFVRFRTTQAAEDAVRALGNGEVFMDDGSLLAGDWKKSARRRGDAGNAEGRRRDETEDMTSRNLIGGKRARSGSKRRSRSRSHRRMRRRSGSHPRADSTGKGAQATSGRRRSRSRHKRRSRSREARGSSPLELVGNEVAGYSNPLFKPKK
uniref:RRM domain-containing protein n=1 Tax=Noctiluca scintillans TaxID=2966 RepID=A0A7S0ZVZ4_NOCSC|mmetsp:Transcript_21202/g.56559  ORF Transcript_21202/g.56559 Transcript_21202/m.56559 type:complete len:205 (+) Transcript_21202:69-683(+)